jgi:anti-anti-sigma factor
MLDDQAYAFALTLHGPYAVVVAEGELDIASVGPMRDDVRHAARRAARVVVDLRAVSFMDTFALRALIALQHEIDEGRDRSLHVVAGDGIQRVLDLTDKRGALCWMSPEQLAA